jgi:uncharacterized membrane protein YdbT with pleckstrin-like domain
MVVGKGERIRFAARLHGITLLPGFALAVVLAGAGLAGLGLGWPWTPAGAFLLAVSALVALQAVWRWERTQVVLTDQRLYVVEGVVRRRSTVAALERVELNQSLVGRAFGYGTLAAGDLEVPFVPDPRRALRVVR